jgi:hypothetical protein
MFSWTIIIALLIVALIGGGLGGYCAVAMISYVREQHHSHSQIHAAR